jgi:hypothetical protein
MRAFVHGERHDVALVGPDFVHQPPHAFAQRFDLLRRKADAHQLVGDGIARLQIGAAARAVLGERARHLAVERPDDREAPARVGLEPQLVGRRGVALLFVLFLGGLDFLFDLPLLPRPLGDRLVVRGGSTSPSTTSSTRSSSLSISRPAQNFGNGGRAADRLDHVTQPSRSRRSRSASA